MADTESAAPGGECKPPESNTCYEIRDADDKLVGSKKGVLHVKL